MRMPGRLNNTWRKDINMTCMPFNRKDILLPEHIGMKGFPKMERAADR